MAHEIYFSRPGGNSEIRDRLLTDIKYAEKHIYISQFSLEGWEFKELVKEKKKNIPTLLILDWRNEKEKVEEGGKTVERQSEFVKDPSVVWLGSKGTTKLMHHKFVIVDDIVWVGSFNLSKNATDNNWESMVRFSDDSHAFSKYTSEFKRMYMLGRLLGTQSLGGNCCVNTCCKDEEDPFHISGHVYAWNLKAHYKDGYEPKNMQINLSVSKGIMKWLITNCKLKTVGRCGDCQKNTVLSKFISYDKIIFRDPDPSKVTESQKRRFEERHQAQSEHHSIEIERVDYKTTNDELLKAEIKYDALEWANKSYKPEVKWICLECLFNRCDKMSVHGVKMGDAKGSSVNVDFV